MNAPSIQPTTHLPTHLVNVRNDVERQGVGKHLILTLPANQVMLHARPQLLHSFCARPTRRLVGGNQEAADAELLGRWVGGWVGNEAGSPNGWVDGWGGWTHLLMQRPQGHDGNGGGAVGVGNQAGSPNRLGIDFRHDQGNVVVVSEGGGVVDDVGTAVGGWVGGWVVGKESNALVHWVCGG